MNTLQEEIYELERQLSILECKDHLSAEDFEHQRMLNTQIINKKRELEKEE